MCKNCRRQQLGLECVNCSPQAVSVKDLIALVEIAPTRSGPKFHHGEGVKRFPVDDHNLELELCQMWTQEQENKIKPQGSSRPVESKTRTHNGRVRSAQRTADCGAGRNWAKQGADISEGNRPSSPVGYRKQTVPNVSSQARTKEIPCKLVEEQNKRLTDGFSAVKPRDRERSSLLAVDQCTDGYLSL